MVNCSCPTNVTHKFKFLVHSREKTNPTTVLLTVPVPTNLRHKFKFSVHSREKTNLTIILWLTVPVHTNLTHELKFIAEREREDKPNYSIINCSCPHKFRTQIQICGT